MRSPVSTPAGIFTASVLVCSTRPSPRQALHGFLMVLPLPPQVGQACWIEKIPFCMRTRPWPRHVPHVSVLPSAEPEPSQVSHMASVGTSISRVTPATACSRSISST